MSRLVACLIFSFNFLSVGSYSYQTEPLFLSFAELEALESGTVDPSGGGGEEEERSSSVMVRCLEDSMEVVMKARLFDPDLPLDPRRLRLGPVATTHCTATLSEDEEYVITAPLLECGNTVMFSEGVVLYSNLLLYSPPSQPEAFRGWGAATPVHCQYRRGYTMINRVLHPAWIPFTSHPARLYRPQF